MLLSLVALQILFQSKCLAATGSETRDLGSRLEAPLTLVSIWSNQGRGRVDGH